MEAIQYHLQILLNHLNEKPVQKNRYIHIGKTSVGSWILADEDVEVAALVVVRYMLKYNYKSIGNLMLHTKDNEQYTFFLNSV